MKAVIIAIFLFTFSWASLAQTKFSPGLILGKRSLVYSHGISQKLAPKLSLNNFSLLDAEYGSTNNLLYFSRTSIKYDLNALAFSTSVGIKNTGIFNTTGAQYKLRWENLQVSYFLGLTLVNGSSTLEQNLALQVQVPILSNTKLYLDAFLIRNSDSQGMDRLIHQSRLGLKWRGLSFGAALKLDYFRNKLEPLRNHGLYILNKF